MMSTILKRLFLVLCLAAIGLYFADWAVFETRLTRDTAFSTVQVDSFLTTRLKGNKAEYDYLGKVDQPCARSIFPHASQPPCWWVRRHKSRWESA